MNVWLEIIKAFPIISFQRVNRAKVAFLREENLSTDTAKSWDVVKDIIMKYKKSGVLFDTITLLQPT